MRRTGIESFVESLIFFSKYPLKNSGGNNSGHLFRQASFPYLEKDSFKKIFPGKNMIYKIIYSMLKDLDLKTKGDGRGPHTFRHYVATNLRYNFRMDLDHVARLLGDTQKTISS